MLQVQDKEAETRLSELLRTVENGETVAITRNGKEVAHLVPAAVDQLDESESDNDEKRAERKAAVEHFLKRRAEWTHKGMSIQEILEVRHQGLRP